MGRRQVGRRLRLVPVGRQGHQADGRRRRQEVRGREEASRPRLLEGELKKISFRRFALEERLRNSSPPPFYGGCREGEGPNRDASSYRSEIGEHRACCSPPPYPPPYDGGG